MNTRTLAGVASVVLCCGIAFSEDQVDTSSCIDQVDLFVEAHAQWLAEKAGSSKGQPLGVLVKGNIPAIQALLDWSSDHPRDDRPRLCADLSDSDAAEGRIVDLENADLAFANLQGVVLNGAILAGANLFGATMTNAKLRDADLRHANLNRARVGKAVFAGADLQFARYTPNPSDPPSLDISNVKGIALVRIEGANNEAGMVQLRRTFRNLGLREHERQATYAIERYRSRTGGIFGFLRYITIGVPTGWGLWPIGAWYGIAISLVAAAICYAAAILIQRRRRSWYRGGIYRVHLSDHLSPGGSGMTIGDSSRVDHLRPRRALWAFTWAFYFALLSCFHIGWRGLNVGLWLARVQTKEFALRGYGWVRVVSGFQSLVSVYLLALWALTYFGRPFE